MTSRALVLEGDRALVLRELPVPDPLPSGYALLQVEGNGLCGSDYDLYVGALRGRLIKLPCVPGHEIAGTIVRTTPQAEREIGISEGDRVAVEAWIRCGRCRPCSIGNGNYCRNLFNYSVAPLDLQPGNGLSGGLAEFMVLRPGTTVHRFQRPVAVEDAVLHNPLGNAIEWTCNAGNVRLGDRVLILGGGQRGIACCIAAKEAGASQIVLTGLRRDKHKLALAQEFGATDTVNVEDEDVRERVAEITGGQGVDVAIDLVPRTTDPVVDAIELVRPGGTVVLAGLKGMPIKELPIDRIVKKSIRVHGAMGLSRWSTERAVRLIDENRYPFSKLHTHVFGLEEAERAIRILGHEIEDEDPIHITITPS